NIQGLGDLKKWRWVRDLCSSHRVNFLAIQESKSTHVELWKLRQIWGNSQFDFVTSSARGMSGGGFNIRWINVYAPQNLSSKIDLWNSLLSLTASWDGVVVMMGDFNEVRNAEERHGSNFNDMHAKIFNNFIDGASLIDVPLGGYNFTWTDKWGSKMSKLDRFLVSNNFHDSFPHATEMERFKVLVEQTWKNDGIINDCKVVLLKKSFKISKKSIRSWIGSKRTETFALKKTHQALLSSIDVKIDLGTANEDDFRIRKESLKILGDLERAELADVSQKVKAKWALEGDENSCFFHNYLKKKRRQLAIRGILKDGNWIEDPSIVKSEFMGHFMARFQQSEGIIPVLDSNYISPISHGQRDLLERPFSRDEIKLAVWDCGGDKASGPDGFSFKFFTFFWDLVENDVVNFMHEFFHTSLFPQGCNSSFIALILKVANAKTVSEFRPINLIGCQYKIIGKLLANKIRVVIGHCVNPVHSAFIKVDFEKAFDSIRWDYLDLVLEKLGFGCRWRSWIKYCLHSARSSVLVNGSPTDDFELHRGLRQGDPLSHFLFILAMEGLHAYTSKAESLGLFKGCSVGRDNLHISHLMYADDVIFIGEWSWSNARNLISLLRCFFLISGLRINIHKSLVIGIGVSDDEVSYMENIIGCGTFKLPLKYLGVPVGCNMSRSSNWNAIIQKFYSKLSSWKARLLSVRGRLTLIRSVLNSLLIYYLSIYQVPSSVRKKLEAMRNSFFIGEATIAAPGDLSLIRFNGLRIMVSIFFPFVPERRDCWVWSLGGNEGFSVASVRGLVDSVMLDNGHDATPWNQYLPIKVNVFVWRLMLNRLPSRVNLDRRNIEVDSLLCPSCFKDVETINHTFFNCSLAKDLWALLAKW
nr:hypothetical protein [Tanacetum cinerariifolium]